MTTGYLETNPNLPVRIKRPAAHSCEIARINNNGDPEWVYIVAFDNNDPSRTWVEVYDEDRIHVGNL